MSNALLEINRIQTKYWGIREARKDKFKRNARELLDREATIVQCPDCCGDRGRWLYCDWCGGQGCRHCQKEICPTCQGEGEVLMHTDGRIEVLI